MTQHATPFALNDFIDRPRLVEIITNPAYDTAGFTDDDLTAQIEHLEQFGGYIGGDFYNECMDVASRLQAHTEQFTGFPSLSYDIASDTDGISHGVAVSIYLSDLNAYLTRYIEGKRIIWRRDTAVGLEAATDVAEALGSAYRDLILAAQRRGLIGYSAADRVRQVADAEQVAIHYQDRGVFEAAIGRALLDHEWAQIAENLDGYDEWIDNSGAAESAATWRDQMIEKAEVAVWCDECAAAMFTDSAGVTHHYAEDSPTLIDHNADADHVAIQRPNRDGR